MSLRLLLVLLLALPLDAQSSVEERLAALEAQMRELQTKNAELEQKLAALTAENETLRNTAPAEEARPPVQPAGPAASAVTVGGLLQVQGESGGEVDSRFTTDNDRIFLRRARVSVQGQLPRQFDFRIEGDATGSLSNASALRLQLTDAYVTWTRHRAAQIRVGQFKTPFGFEQLYSDIPLPTPERTLMSDRLTLGRQLGLQLSGSLVPERLQYAVGAFNGNGTNVNFNDDEGFLVAGRLSGTLWRDARLRLDAGANAYRSDDATAEGAAERRGWGVDAQLTLGRTAVWAELLQSSGAARGEGWSVQTTYDLLRDRLQGVLRYDDLRGTPDAQGTWLGGLNYYLRGHDLKLQLHYLRGEDDGRIIARLQTVF